MELLLPPAVGGAIARLEEAGFPAWAVGGCVRDRLLGRAPGDWDLATGAPPEEVRRLFAGWVQPGGGGEAFGTVCLAGEGARIEVTPLRREGDYPDGRHPAWVAFGATLEEDLARRDFTVNAMAYHPGRGLTDPFGGLGDLRQKRVCTVGPAALRFGQDRLRVLRLARFCAQLGFAPGEGAAGAALQAAPALAQLPGPVVAGELLKWLAAPQAGAALRRFGAVAAGALPELCCMLDFDQRTPHHAYPLWEHTCRVVERVPAQPVLRLAALLHDMAKPACQVVDVQKGVCHYKAHAQLGQQMAGQVLRRLGLPGEMVQAVSALIGAHRTALPAQPAALRRLGAQLGPGRMQQLWHLQWADAWSKKAAPPPERFALAAAGEQLAAWRERPPCLSVGQLAIGGEELLGLGARPGPAVGRLLQRLLAAVLDEPALNQRASLLALAARWQAEEGE